MNKTKFAARCVITIGMYFLFKYLLNEGAMGAEIYYPVVMLTNALAYNTIREDGEPNEEQDGFYN